MEVAVPNLFERNGRFHFRFRLPANYLSGKNCEIRMSLKTKDLKKAVSQSKLMTEKLQALIDSGEYMAIPLSELREMAKGYITQRLEDHNRHMADWGHVCPETRQEGSRIALNIVKHYEQAVRDNDPGSTVAMQNAKNLLTSVPHVQSDINLLAHELLLAELFIHRMQYERITGKRFLTQYSDTVYEQVINGNYPTAQEISKTVEKNLLGKLISSYLAAPHPTWGVKTREDIKHTLELFLQYMQPDTDIETVRHRDLLQFRDEVLMKIPARRALYSKFRGVPLSELTKNHGKPLLAMQTINHNCVRLGGFFKWCYDHEYIGRNPASNLLIKLDNKASNERNPYSTDDLKLLLSNLRRDRLSAWKPHKYWIPLIALFSGLRQAEICQLYPDDIVNANGIACFDIKANPERKSRLKNKNARRTIPVHPILLQLGFLDFVLSRAGTRRARKVEDDRLWICLVYTEKYGYTHTYEKSFGRFNRKYVTNDEKKVFHSLRHNVANCLKQSGAQESLVAEIMGHAVQGLSFSRYGKEFNPEILLKNLKLLNYGFDVFKVLGKTPLKQPEIDEQIARLTVLNK